MPRAKGGVKTRRRHNRRLELTKGHRSTSHRLQKRAHESMMHSLYYAYVHRRERKGDMRKLWIARISAAVRAADWTYSQFVHAMTIAGIAVNRKMLADMAVRSPGDFTRFLEEVKAKAAA